MKSQGVPNLSSQGFAIIMNIIHIEGAMEGLRKMQQREKSVAAKHKYTVWLDDYTVKLEGLTWRLEPKKLVEQIITDIEFSVYKD
jgi:hypothetical protein